MCICLCLCAGLYTWGQVPQTDQKRALVPLDLELQMIANIRWVLGTNSGPLEEGPLEEDSFQLSPVDTPLPRKNGVTGLLFIIR